MRNTIRLDRQATLGWACQCVHFHGPDRGYHIIQPVVTIAQIAAGNIPDGMKIFCVTDTDHVACATCGEIQPLDHPITHRASLEQQRADFRVADSVVGYHLILFHPTVRAQQDRENQRLDLSQVTHGARLLYVATEGPDDIVVGASPASYAGFPCPPEEHWQGSVRYYEFPRTTYEPSADGLTGRFVYSVMVEWDAEKGEVISEGPKVELVLAYSPAEDGETPTWQVVSASASLPLGTPIFRPDHFDMELVGQKGPVDPFDYLGRVLENEEKVVMFDTIPPAPAEGIWAEFTPDLQYDVMKARLSMLTMAMGQALTFLEEEARLAQMREDAEPYMAARIRMLLARVENAHSGLLGFLDVDGLTDEEVELCEPAVSAHKLKARLAAARQTARELNDDLGNARAKLARAQEETHHAMKRANRLFGWLLVTLFVVVVAAVIGGIMLNDAARTIQRQDSQIVELQSDLVDLSGELDIRVGQDLHLQAEVERLLPFEAKTAELEVKIADLQAEILGLQVQIAALQETLGEGDPEHVRYCTAQWIYTDENPPIGDQAILSRCKDKEGWYQIDVDLGPVRPIMGGTVNLAINTMSALPYNDGTYFWLFTVDEDHPDGPRIIYSRSN